MGLSLRKLLNGYTKNLTGAKLLIANTFTSFLACSTAGFLNAFVMRKTELKKGIEFFTEFDQDTSVGKSKVCA
jgi:hypothetical protein